MISWSNNYVHIYIGICTYVDILYMYRYILYLYIHVQLLQTHHTKRWEVTVPHVTRIWSSNGTERQFNYFTLETSRACPRFIHVRVRVCMCGKMKPESGCCSSICTTHAWRTIRHKLTCDTVNTNYELTHCVFI